MRTLSSQTGAIHPPLHMSEEQFVRWADEDTHAEWVEVKMPIDRIHGAIQFWLRSLIQGFVKRRKLEFVEGQQFTMRLGHVPSRRDPEVLYVSADNEHLVQRTFVDGPADPVVEIVSPDSASGDYREKYHEYEAGGVAGYWIVNPDNQEVEAHALGASGRYERLPIGEDGIIRSKAMPGFWFRLADVFMAPAPEIEDLLKQMAA
jgi:Uma2 family endonuclease